MENKTLKGIVDFYGKDLQKVVAMEEMSELIQAISKDIRGDTDYVNLVEEIGDVQIMLDELKIIYDIPEEAIENEIEYKISRTISRIDGIY